MKEIAVVTRHLILDFSLRILCWMALEIIARITVNAFEQFLLFYIRTPGIPIFFEQCIKAISTEPLITECQEFTTST
jgi:hypothetical protein